MMQTCRLGLVAAFAVFAMSAPAAAQGTGQGQIMQQCQAEIAKHCASMQHGSGGVPACLEQHKGDLSETCRNALSSHGPGSGRGMRGEGMGRGGTEGRGRMRGPQ